MRINCIDTNFTLNRIIEGSWNITYDLNVISKFCFHFFFVCSIENILLFCERTVFVRTNINWTIVDFIPFAMAIYLRPKSVDTFIKYSKILAKNGLIELIIKKILSHFHPFASSGGRKIFGVIKPNEQRLRIKNHIVMLCKNPISLVT